MHYKKTHSPNSGIPLAHVNQYVANMQQITNISDKFTLNGITLFSNSSSSSIVLSSSFSLQCTKSQN